jgi:organic radical activating enzyme
VNEEGPKEFKLPVLDARAAPEAKPGVALAEDPEPGKPITVLMIEAVGKCNATCAYCPRGKGLLGPGTNDFITMETLDKALSLATGGGNHAVYLHHRGEPFLHPNLPEIVRRVRERGFYAFLSTNLISATPARVERVLKAGINQVEMHYSAGLTRLPHELLLQRIHEIRKLNFELRNFGCRLEMNFGLEGQTREAVMEELARHKYYDETFYVRWFEPHDWPSLEHIVDRGVSYRSCQWYKYRACAVLANGDVVICCLDQFGHSRRVNVNEIDQLKWEHLADRRMCAGCVQHVEMDWLKEDAIDMPRWLARKLEIDTWTA